MADRGPRLDLGDSEAGPLATEERADLDRLRAENTHLHQIIDESSCALHALGFHDYANEMRRVATEGPKDNDASKGSVEP